MDVLNVIDFLLKTRRIGLDRSIAGVVGDHFCPEQAAVERQNLPLQRFAYPDSSGPLTQDRLSKADRFSVARTG